MEPALSANLHSRLQVVLSEKKPSILTKLEFKTFTLGSVGPSIRQARLIRHGEAEGIVD